MGQCVEVCPTGTTPMLHFPASVLSIGRAPEQARRSYRAAACACRGGEVGRASNGLPRGRGRRLSRDGQVRQSKTKLVCAEEVLTVAHL